MFHLVLCRPRIAANTGNIIRLCANTGCRLHLIRPLGFVLDDKRLKRAGLDYHASVSLKIHDSLAAFCAVQKPTRLWAVETCGRRRYDEVRYAAEDAIVLGAETSGLDRRELASVGDASVVNIPMQTGNRSLNLANAAAVVVYEAWRQQAFGNRQIDG